jgi:hypothetical protein
MFVCLGFTWLKIMGAAVQHGRVKNTVIIDRCQGGLTHSDAAIELLHNPQSFAVKRSETVSELLSN